MVGLTAANTTLQTPSGRVAGVCVAPARLYPDSLAATNPDVTVATLDDLFDHLESEATEPARGCGQAEAEAGAGAEAGLPAPGTGATVMRSYI